MNGRSAEPEMKLSGRVAGPPRAGQDPVPGIPDASLRAAASRVAATLGADELSVLPEPQLLEEVAALAVAVCRPGAPIRPAGTPAEAALRVRLVDRLRAKLLQEWGRTPPTTEGMLEQLGRIEELRGEAEGSEAGTLASQLAGPRGLELTVEFAHDLRSPLTSILFLAETLLNSPTQQRDRAQREQLAIIYSAALRLVSMASDVIELARGGDSLAEQEPSEFSIAELLTSLRDLLHPLVEERGIELRLRPPEQPSRLGHPVALSRVLMNLASNAIRHTEEGFVEIAVHEIGPTRLEFSVRDTGSGMDEDVVRQLFSPFRLAPRHGRRSFSGSGLGLSICRKLLELMGSALEFDTRQGEGTRFHFVLDLPHSG